MAVFSTFYINVRLFDLESDFFPTLGRMWAIKNHDGDVFHETYGSRTFAVICLDCDEWRKWLADTAGWMVKAFGVRGIYLDQLGSVFWAELGDRFCKEDGRLLDHFRAALRLRTQAAPAWR